MRNATLVIFIGLSALGCQSAMGAERSQAYETLVSAASRADDRSWNLEKVHDSHMISFEGAAGLDRTPVSAAKTGPSFKKTVLDNAGQGWNKGMKFVDWYDKKVIKPVAGPENASWPRKIGGFFYTLVNLPVILLGFWAAAALAGAGAVRGVFKAVQKS